MGTSSGANFQQQHQHPALQQGQGMPPPPALQTSLSLGGGGGGATSPEQVGLPPDALEPLSNSDGGHDSATEIASSRETWPGEPSTTKSADGGVNAPPVAAAPITAVRMAGSKDKEVVVVVGNDVHSLQALRGRIIPGAGRVTLREIARDRVDVVTEKMKVVGEEALDEVKTELRSILEGSGGSHHVEEFLYLQKLVQSRVDLTPAALSVAHLVKAMNPNKAAGGGAWRPDQWATLAPRGWMCGHTTACCLGARG